MPNTSSAKKALRQSLPKKAMNRRRKNNFKVAIKELRKAVATNANDKAIGLLPFIYKSLDKAAKSNTIKKNKASRLKSRLSRLLKPATA